MVGVNSGVFFYCSANMLNVNEGPSPSKIFKPYKKKEENAMRFVILLYSTQRFM